MRAVITFLGIMAVVAWAQGGGAPPVAKVKVTAEGEIHLNKRAVSFEKLTEELTRLKAAEGVVWYYREQPQKEPSPKAERTADAVIKKIIELKLPVRLSRKDFE